MGTRGKYLLLVFALLAIVVFSVGCTADEPSTSIIADQAEEAAESAAESDPLPEEPEDDSEPVMPDSGRDIEWIVEDEGVWPDGLLPAAQEFVAEVSGFDKMTLRAPEVAASGDGSTWAVFSVGVTDQPTYESMLVVMTMPGGGSWQSVDAGTGMSRDETLPKDLASSSFASDAFAY